MASPLWCRKGRRGPDEPSALQTLGIERHAETIVPENLDQDEQVPAVRIALQLLLHQQRQAIEALAHVGVAGRQPHPHAARDRDHRGRAIFASPAIRAETIAGSAAPVIRMRVPPANSISIVDGVAADAAAAGTIATGENVSRAPAGAHSCCRHRNNWLVWIPAARATSEADAPGASAAATIRSFSARDHRRRRCTDVIISTAPLVIGLSLGL